RQRRLLRVDRRGHGGRAARSAGSRAARPAAPRPSADRDARHPRSARRGGRRIDLALEMLGDLGRINIKGGLPVAEAFAWHEKLIERRGQDYDPRIRTRIERGRDMTAAEYIHLLEARADFIRRFDAETHTFDALIMPTVPMTAPPIAAFARDEDYARLNLKLLRNTSIT